MFPHFMPGGRQMVFERETVPCRHIWLLDLSTGKEQQLTKGSVLDDLVDVSPSGRHLLLGRSTNRGMGRMLKVFLLSLDSGDIRELMDCWHARFIDQGEALLVSQGGHIAQATLDGQIGSQFVSGSLLDVCDTAQLAVISDFGAAQQPNDQLLCLDLSTKQTEPIGSGHSPRIFPNGKVLFFQGYDHQAIIWQKGAAPRGIASPLGYKVFPNRARGASQAGVFVMQPNSGSRSLDIYIFDSMTEKFTPVITNIAP